MAMQLCKHVEYFWTCVTSHFEVISVTLCNNFLSHFVTPVTLCDKFCLTL